MCYSILRTKYRKTMTGANPEYTECESAEDEARKIEERQQRPEAISVKVFRCASELSRREVWDHAPYVAPVAPPKAATAAQERGVAVAFDPDCPSGISGPTY